MERHRVTHRQVEKQPQAQKGEVPGQDWRPNGTIKHTGRMGLLVNSSSSEHFLILSCALLTLVLGKRGPDCTAWPPDQFLGRGRLGTMIDSLTKTSHKDGGLIPNGREEIGFQGTKSNQSWPQALEN